MWNITQAMKRVVRREINLSNMIVNFIICGVQKGGTSALDAYLREHPEICMANEKEVHFFDNEAYFVDGKPDYSKYHSSFSPRSRIS